MTIELANRLVEFRKKFGFSQEELANKLKVSRQSISNWESGEVTPSIDYLKELSIIYGVSLDDLVSSEKSVEEVLNKKGKSADQTADNMNASNSNSTKTNFGTNGFYVKDGKNTVNISRDGIFVDSEDGEQVRIDKRGININKGGKETYYERNDSQNHVSFDNDIKSVTKVYSKARNRKKLTNKIEGIITGCSALIITVIYFLLGFLLKNVNGWAVYWTLFILIPVPGQLLSAIIRRKFCNAPVPLIITFTYLFLGMRFGLWNPWWLLFLIIPIYYTIFGPVDKAIFEHQLNKERKESVITINDKDIKVRSSLDDDLVVLENAINEAKEDINSISKIIVKCKSYSHKELVEDFKDDIEDSLDDLDEKIGDIEDMYEKINKTCDMPLETKLNFKSDIRGLKDSYKDLKEKQSSL